MKKDLKAIIKALEAQGFEVVRNKRGHYDAYRNGRKVATFAGTPSDHRSWRNSIAQARRAGFKWPPGR